MHSFKPSLSFLLSLLILPLLQSQHLSLSDPPASLAFAQAAGLEVKDGLLIYGPGNSDATSDDFQISAAHHGSNSVRISHGKISRELLARMERSQLLSLHPGRRAANAQFTHYVTGLGACGNYNVPSDYVVALNAQQWDNGAHCYAPVTITIKGKSVQATIVDRCEKCGFNNIDLTDGLFAVWGGDGVLQGEWEYGTSAAAPPPPPPPKKTTTTPPAPKPTSTKIPPTTSNPVPTSTTKITPSSTHASSSTEISSSTSQSTSSTSKTSTGSLPDPTSQSVQNLELLYLANLGIGGIAFSSLHN